MTKLSEQFEGKLFLPNITLVAVDTTTDVEATSMAIKYSCRDIVFGRVLLISNYNPNPNSKEYDFIKIKAFKNISEWCEFIVFELFKFINTDFIILIHADGFIVNSNKWTNNFLNYDYIGSPWPLSKHPIAFKDSNGNVCRVGNSVSLRSKKILEMPTKLNLRWENFVLNFPHEDGYLCAQHKVLLESNGIKFAPLEVAIHFGRELPIPENRGISPFLFHKWKGENKHFPNFSNQKIYIKLFKFFKKFFSKLT
jgi:hypothetical protein